MFNIKKVDCNVKNTCEERGKGVCFLCFRNKNHDIVTDRYKIGKLKCWCCGNTYVADGCKCNNCGETV